MLVAAASAAFLLGMRHGADPDHVAAIDNLTRGSARTRGASFVGTLFAGGHAFMVIAITSIIALAGKHLAFGSHLETAGTWLSVVILIAMAAYNFRRLRDPTATVPVGLRTRLFSKLMCRERGPLAAIPIGFLFGLGFETPTQIAAYAVMVAGGASSIVVIGAAFCLGMIATDTCDSLFVARLIRNPRAAGSGRPWLWAVTLSALGVALLEIAQLAGVPMALGELQTSAVLVGALVSVYAWLVVTDGFRRRRRLLHLD